MTTLVEADAHDVVGSTRFTLHSHGLASYGWNTQIITLSAFAAERTVRMRLASTADRIAPWETALEFRSAAATTHELCHYLQDIGSGAGHRDLEASVRFLRESAFISVASPFLGENLGEYRGDLLSSLGRLSLDRWNTYIDARAYVPRSMETARRAQRRRAALRMVGVDPAHVDEFCLEFILELEAYLYTLCTLNDFEMTKPQADILVQQMGAVALRAMPSQSFLLFTTICAQMGADHSKLSMQEVRAITRVVSLLVECALAVAPIGDGPLVPLDPHDLPEVRFATLLVALGKMNSLHTSKFATAVFSNEDDAAEDSLVAHTASEYVRRERSYGKWLSVFDAWQKPSEHWTGPLLRSRARVADTRWLRGVSNGVCRSIDSLTWDQATPIYRTREGYNVTSCDPELLLNPVNSRAYLESHDTFASHMAFAEYLHGVGAFRCHSAVDDLCGARIPLCRSKDAEWDAISAAAPRCPLTESLGGMQRLIDGTELSRISRRRRQMKRVVDQKFINEIVDRTTTALHVELVDAGSLNMDIPPEIIGEIAERIVTGIISGFVSRWMYDEWKDRRAKRLAVPPVSKAIGHEVLVAPQVPEEEMVIDITVDLTGEGVPAKTAEELVRSTISYVGTVIDIDPGRLK